MPEWATRRSRGSSRSAARRCIGPSGASWKAICRPPSAKGPRPGAARKLSGKETALLVAAACSSPPAGRQRWTLDLLAGEMVRLTDHATVSRETVRRRLAEDDLKPWRRDMWCIPQVDGEYVARMEDVLDLYAEPADPQRPVVCFDESPTQLMHQLEVHHPQSAPEARSGLSRHHQRVRISVTK